MRSLIIILFLILTFAISCSAKTYIVKDNFISIGLTELENKNIIISSILDEKTKTDFIKKIDYPSSLWSLKVKKDKEFASKEIILSPSNSEKLTVENLTNKIKLTWLNVKTSDMSDGFDVIITCGLNSNDSLWNINIKSHTQNYGIWQVIFPCVDGLDYSNNNILMTPNFGGILYKSPEIINQPADKYPSTTLPMQFTSLTKAKSTLYMSTEDLKSKDKIFSWQNLKPNEVTFKITNNPDYMGVAGHDYNQEYKFNISTMSGDWFDAAKKYRKWGIDNNYTPFSQGRIDKRNDYPEWMKKLPVWLGLHNFTDKYMKDLEDYQKFLGVPAAVHVYNWSQHRHDTYYPNFLPAWDVISDTIKRVKANDMHVMLYTNVNLVDTKNSPTYKEYGDNLLSLDPEKKTYQSLYNADGLANNMTSCPTVPEYYNQIIKEESNIEKQFNVDAFYLDQMACEPATLCFNETHSHPTGGGSRWADTYYNMVNDIRKSTKAIKGAPVIITTEGCAESYPVDAWLRASESVPYLTPIQTIVYSGYVASFGSTFYEEEFKTENALPAINKAATQLIFGYQLGWGWNERQWEDYPDFGKYIKTLSQARYAAYKFFNLGEMVRDVNFKTQIPTKSIMWKNNAIIKNYDQKIIKTVSYNYNNETAVTFTNITKEPFTFNWYSNAKDLYLKSKTNYNISQLYPTKKQISTGKIEGKITIKPLETIVLIIK